MTASSSRSKPAASSPATTPRAARLRFPALAALIAGVAGVAVALVAVWHALEAIAGRDYVGALLALVAGLGLYAASIEALRIATVAVCGNPDATRADGARCEPSQPNGARLSSEFTSTNVDGAPLPGAAWEQPGARRSREALR